MLKVGLVGVGNISGVHIPAWKAMKETEIVAMCDIRPERMEGYPEVHRYTDFDTMLEKEELDIVDICLPTYLHADYAVKAMERGIHVLSEKPVSLKREDVARLYATAHRMNVKYMVAQVLRFWPEYEMIKKMNDEGTYGKLLSGRMARIGQAPLSSWNNWMLDEKLSGLVSCDLHIHDLDFLVYAFGKPKNFHVSRVKKEGQDSIGALYDFGDFFVTAEAGWYAAAYPFEMSFRFQFEKAVAVMNGSGLSVYLCDGTILEPLAAGGISDTMGLPSSDAYANEIRYFTDCVLEDRFPDKVRPEELETVLDILHTL